LSSLFQTFFRSKMSYGRNSRPRPPEELIDDGSFHCCSKIGRSYLICGKKSTKFPFQCFVRKF
jgi:hypothetical protein